MEACKTVTLESNFSSQSNSAAGPSSTSAFAIARGEVFLSFAEFFAASGIQPFPQPNAAEWPMGWSASCGAASSGKLQIFPTSPILLLCFVATNLAWRICSQCSASPSAVNGFGSDGNACDDDARDNSPLSPLCQLCSLSPLRVGKFHCVLFNPSLK
jgi:hypothetical protein